MHGISCIHAKPLRALSRRLAWAGAKGPMGRPGEISQQNACDLTDLTTHSLPFFPHLYPPTLLDPPSFVSTVHREREGSYRRCGEIALFFVARPSRIGGTSRPTTLLGRDCILHRRLNDDSNLIYHQSQHVSRRRVKRKTSLEKILILVCRSDLGIASLSPIRTFPA